MAMNRWLCVLLVHGVLAHAHAQWNLSRTDAMRVVHATHSDLISLEAWGDYNANSIRNELVTGLWRGSYLDRDLRERSRAAMRERNSVGYVLGGRITWTGSDKVEGHEGWRSLMSLAYHEQMGARFTRDLYALTFFGNADYEGRRADVGPAAVTRIGYQTIGVGMQHARTGSYVRLDFVIGQRYDAVDVKWAGLYTGTDGRVLRATVLGDHYRSDTASSRFGQVNGFGLAVSGRWEKELQRCLQGARISLEVEDLGFASWTATSQRLHKDTILEYSGIRVANILALDDVLIGEDQLADTFGFRYRNGSFSTLLPFLLRAGVRMPVGERWSGTATVDQRNLPGYVPQLAFAGERQFSDRTQAGASLSLGGWGGLRMGAMVRTRVGERLVLEASSPHLPGFFPGSTKGAGVLFNALVAF